MIGNVNESRKSDHHSLKSNRSSQLSKTDFKYSKRGLNAGRNMKVWQPNILMNLNPDFRQNFPHLRAHSWSRGAVEQLQGILLIPNQALAAKHLNRFSVPRTE